MTKYALTDENGNHTLELTASECARLISIDDIENGETPELEACIIARIEDMTSRGPGAEVRCVESSIFNVISMDDYNQGMALLQN